MNTINDEKDIAIYNACNKYYQKEITFQEFANKLFEVKKIYKISLIEIITRYKWLTSMDINPNFIKLEENHNQIYALFDQLNLFFNKFNIEFYYTSGILSYILVDKELERYHHDLDVFVNMKDLNKIEELARQNGFIFERQLGDRSDGTKRIMIKLHHEEYMNIPITIFMYVREKDNSITQKDYFFKDNELMVENIYNSHNCVKLSFSDSVYFHNNIPYKSITLEALYLSKLGNRPKDIYDCNIFEENIDKEKLEKLRKELESNKANEIIATFKDKYRDFMLKNSEENIIQKVKK